MNSFLTVPFLSDAKYIAYLTECADELDSIHFILPGGHLSGGSALRGMIASPDKVLQQGLGQLPGPKKYALFNSRCYNLAFLRDGKKIQPLLHLLGQLLDHGLVDGIVYSDYSLLRYLSDMSPDIVSRLEAVPGQNARLDSLDKIEAQFAYIRSSGFKLPRKITLDNPLNRDLDRLAHLSLQIHERFPGIRVEVLANEGCLYHCPFYSFRDVYTAYTEMEGRSPLIVGQSDCMRLFEQEPYRILQSPFIRPEDVDFYRYHVDVIRLYGRLLGPGFLMQAIQAYRNRRYEGNLLELLATLSWMSDRLFIDNRILSSDFVHIFSRCDKQCAHCGFCQDLFDAVATPLVSRGEEQKMNVQYD